MVQRLRVGPPGDETPEVVRVFYPIYKGGLYGGVAGVKRIIADRVIKQPRRSRMDPEVVGELEEALGEDGIGSPSPYDELLCDIASDMLREGGSGEFKKPPFQMINIPDYVNANMGRLRQEGSSVTRRVLDEWGEWEPRIRDATLITEIGREELFKKHCVGVKYREDDCIGDDWVMAYLALEVPQENLVRVHRLRAVASGDIDLDYARRLVLKSPEVQEAYGQITHLLEQNNLNHIRVETPGA
ncbi:MAG: hypothetical protein ABH851_03605 [Methanobacteriota archaeon]